MWQQTYLLFGLGSFGSSLIASLPIVVMLLLLGVFRKPAWMAALSGLLATILLALLIYRMPPSIALSAAANGAAFGLLPIAWVVFWAIVIFRLTVDSGNFEVIKDSIELLTPDPRLQALLVAFAFGGFLEGAAGFGTPVAIAASMLIGLGFSPFSASAICLLANTAPVAFGSLGVPLLTLAGTTGLPVNHLASLTAAICAPLAIITPIYLLTAVGGTRVLRGMVFPALMTGTVFGVVQFFIATHFGPQLADILAALLVMVAIVLYNKLRPTVQRTDHVALAKFVRLGAFESCDPIHPSQTRVMPQHSMSAILRAWMPYGLLVVCVLIWGMAPVQALLNRASIPFGWPHLHDLVSRMPPVTAAPSPYHAMYTFNLLAASGTACMVAAILSARLLGRTLPEFGRTLVAVVHQLRWPILIISAVLAIAFLMNYSGATATLGLALAKTGRVFPFFSITLGWLGVFLTGSDTSANALFGTLQVITAKNVGVSPALMAAANSAGGTLGKMISLQTIAIAAGATGLSAIEQARLFRFTLRHSLVLLSFGGLIVLTYTYIFHLS